MGWGGGEGEKGKTENKVNPKNAILAKNTPYKSQYK